MVTQQELCQIKNTPLLDLFPEVTPYSTGYIAVGDGHELYWEQSGNPEGMPVVVLHGGPGSGAGPIHRRFFDPDHYRIVIFDQRGCGRSTPLGSLEGNTRQNLVDDMEKLRAHLNIDKWMLFGGSWGSTLALSYAAQHADRCLAMILRGIFLCEKEEIDWFMSGIQTIFPEAWDQFSGLFDESDPEKLLQKYYAALTGDDKDLQMQAAIRWSLYEGACSLLHPNYDTITTDEQKEHALTLAKTGSALFRE